MKKIIVTITLSLTTLIVFAQIQTYENHLFALEIGEGFSKQVKNNEATFSNPKVSVIIKRVLQYRSAKGYLIEKNSKMQKNVSAKYETDSIKVGSIFIPRSITRVTMPNDTTKIMIWSVAFNDETDDGLYDLSFYFSQRDPVIAVWAVTVIESIKFKKQLKLVTGDDFFLATTKYAEEGSSMKRTSGYSSTSEKKIDGLKAIREGDKLIISSSKGGLSFLKEWPEYRRSENGGSGIYSTKFELNLNFSLNSTQNEEYGFGFANIFYRDEDYTADTARYISFYITNKGNVYYKTAKKKYDEYSMCASCWGTFKRDTPKEIFKMESNNKRAVQLNEKRNELKIILVSDTYYVFLNKILVLKQTKIERGVSYDISPIPVLFNKGDITIYSQSEEFYYYPKS